MNLVTRPQWGARPPKSPIPGITSTVTTGHWEGPSLWGGQIGSHGSCAPKVRAIQAFHMDSNGWTDIAYNALACPHGYVFEGRGPGKRSAANGTNTSNATSAVCCYLGGQGDPFTAEGQNAMNDAASWLGAPMLKGHRDWYNTACPGDTIYRWIQQGPSSPGPAPPSPATGAGPGFPYPPDHYLGQPDPDDHCHSGFYGDPDTHNVQVWQAQMSARGWTIGVDGRYGPQSAQVAEAFQHEKGLTADGLVGPVTWEATWTAPVT